MKKSEVLFGVLRIPLDGLAVLAALLLSYRLREANVDLIPRVQLLEPAETLPNLVVFTETFVVPGMAIFIVIAAFMRLYTLRATRSAWEEIGNIITTSVLWLIAVVAWYFLIRKELFYSRILLLHATFFITLFVMLVRTSVVLLQRACLRMGIGVRSVATLGVHSVVQPALETLQEDIRFEYLGHLPNLAALATKHMHRPVDLVLQTDPNPASQETIQLINYCRSQHIGYGYLPPVLSDVPHQLQVERLGLLPLMRFQPTPLDGWGRVYKRLFDIAISLTLIIALIPVWILASIAILIDSGWPIFYVSWRTGERARVVIPVLKFRTMVRDADAQKAALMEQNERRDGPLFKIRHDPRITRIGRLLRRFDTDELPQLLNVLLGQMSLVGPRPHLPEEVDRYLAHQRRVFAVKPGITGLAQVSGRCSLQFEDEVRLDLQYIEEWSIWLDLWILWRSVLVVLKGKSDG